MATRIRIQGFQAIDDVELVSDGFSVVVGDSNIGKSSIIRAIHCALTGAVGPGFVRHDPKTCARIKKNRKTCTCKSVVTIDFGDRKLVWEKGDTDNRYVVHQDGTTEEYNSVRGTPDFLRPDFAPLKLGDTSYLLQVGEQFTGPLFLLNQPGSLVADVLGDVAKIDDINQALSLVSKDRRSTQSTLKVRFKDIEDLRTELKEFEGLDDVLQSCSDVVNCWKDLDSKRDSLKEATAFWIRFEPLVRTIRSLMTVQTVRVPSLDDLTENHDLLSSVDDFIRRGVRLAVSIRSLQPVVNIPIPDSDSFQESIDRLELVCRVEQLFHSVESLEVVQSWPVPSLDELSILSGRLDLVHQTLSVGSDVEALSKVVDLDLPVLGKVEDRLDDLQKITYWIEDIRRAGQGVRGLQHIQEIPLTSLDGVQSKLAELRETQEFCSRESHLSQSIRTLERRLSALSGELQDIESQFNDLGVCPTCGSDQHLRKEHL